MKRIFNKFKTNEFGTASIEFVLVAPFLILILMSTLAASDAANAKRNLTTASSTVADLSTRVTEMTKARSDTILQTGTVLIGKYASNAASPVLTIASVTNTLGDNKDTLAVTWSTSSVSGKELKTADLTNYTFPTIPDGESVILVHLKIDYVPTFMSKYFNGLKMESIAIRRPRFVIEVPYKP